jgi:hypothetical protein
VKDRVPKVSARIALPGTGPVEDTFLIDTGAGGALSLNTPFIEKNGLQALAKNSIPIESGGVGGEYKSSIGRAQSFQLGKSIIEAPNRCLVPGCKGRYN